MSATGSRGADGTPGQIFAAPVDLAGAKMIDAEKLLATMERLQAKKKKARAKQLAEMAEKEAAAAKEAAAKEAAKTKK